MSDKKRNQPRLTEAGIREAVAKRFESQLAHPRATIVRCEQAAVDALSTESFGEALHVLALQARLMIGAHQAAVSFVPDGDFQEAIHTHSFSPKYERYNSYDVMPTGDGVWGCVVQHRVAMRLSQKQLLANPRWANFSDLVDARGLDHPPMRGWLAVPMETRDGTFLGMLQLSDKYEGDFTADDQEQLTRLALLFTPTFELQLVNQQLEERVRRRTEKLRMAEERFRLVLKAPITLFTQDVDLRFTWVYNPADGFDGDALIGKTDEDLVPPGQAAAPIAIKRRVLETGVASRDEICITVDGRTSWYDLHVEPRRDASGELIGIAAVSVDITERVQAARAALNLERQMRAAQKMEAIGRLAGGIAHDFNNILAVINGLGELLREDLPRGEPAYEDAGRILDATQRAARLTAQLLAFGRGQPQSLRAMNLNETVHGMTDMLQRLLGADVVLDVRPSLRLGTVMADLSQMEQVLVNVAVNAREAMPAGGRLTIETCNVVVDDAQTAETETDIPNGSYVMLAMTDTGAGIDEQTRTRIFEPFFSTKGQDASGGLGLATVYGIVTQSGGHIRVDSEVGRGTTFSVYLPNVQAAPIEMSVPAGPRSPAAGQGEIVLLVEDGDDLRAVATRQLENSGYRVLTARNGADALLLFQQHECSIDVLVTDVVMPRMGGPELARWLTKLCPGLAVVYMSGYAGDSIRGQVGGPTDVNLIRKPFSRQTLLHAVREALNGDANPPADSV